MLYTGWHSGVAHLVVHGTSGSTSYETIPSVPLETSKDVLSTVDMVVQRQRRDGPRRLRELYDDDDGVDRYPGAILSRNLYTWHSEPTKKRNTTQKKQLEMHGRSPSETKVAGLITQC